MKYIPTALLIILFISAAFSPQEEQANSTAANKGCQTTISGEKSLKYLLHLPEGYGEGGQKYPLMLFLHGAGERGDALELLNANGLPRLLNREDITLPFITVSPQCPSDDYWSSKTQLRKLNALLDDIIKNYNVDETRIYLTGLSMGGFGTFALAAKYPDRFAAIAPVCGGWNPADAFKMKQIPIWVFHGAKDNVVPARQSEDMVEALKRVGGNVKFTLYPEAYHDSWTETYFNPELYEWFLSYSKQNDGAVQKQRSTYLNSETTEALFLKYITHRFPFSFEQSNVSEEFTFTMDIENPLNVPVTIAKEWQFAKGSTWQVEELNTTPAIIKPGETWTTTFRASHLEGGKPFPLPSLKLSAQTQTRKEQSQIPLPWDVDDYIRNHPVSYKTTYANSAPVVDGRLDDEVWAECTVIDDFSCNDMTSVPLVGTKAQIAYDSLYCYLAIECNEPYTDQLSKQVSVSDGPVWIDDSFEFFLDTDNKRQNYFQFVVNSKGVLFDAYQGVNTFNTEAEIVSHISKDYWSVEMAIPWGKLNSKPPVKGQEMGFLIGRNRKMKIAEDERGKEQVLQFPVTNGRFHRKEFFGNLEF